MRRHLLAARIVGDHRREALAVRRNVVVETEDARTPQRNLRPHPRLPGRERVAFGGVADRHHALVQSQKKQFPAVAGPHRIKTSARRNLPSPSRPRERAHVHFMGPRLIRRIGQPAPVRRKRREAFLERRTQEQFRFAGSDPDNARTGIGFHRHGENVLAPAVPGLDNS